MALTLPSNRQIGNKALSDVVNVFASLDTSFAPLLPLSPPPSPSSSKRKLDALDGNISKRQRHDHPTGRRTDGVTSTSSNSPSNASKRSDLGQTKSTSKDQLPKVQTPALPIRRPRRGKPTAANSEPLYDKMEARYYENGRALKYSGDARFWSNQPTNNEMYKPLINPPPPDSPYHRHSALFARLEILDALVCFTYHIWLKDFRRKAFAKENWETIFIYIRWMQSKLKLSDANSPSEQAILGIVPMIYSFIRDRQISYIHRDNVGRLTGVVQAATAAVHRVGQESLRHVEAPQATTTAQTPPMLPSPAITATSATSTPATNEAELHPTNDHDSIEKSPSGNPPKQYKKRHREDKSYLTLLPTEMLKGFPTPPEEKHPTRLQMQAASEVKAYMDMHLAIALDQQLRAVGENQAAFKDSLKFLNLTTLATHFPQTFARVIHTSLSDEEEYEPDMEDMEGELYWPGQCPRGEGIGWVCLMGRAMINEFGRPLGYLGLEGLIPKP